MDYVREELLRQRRALEALMGGAESAEEEPTAEDQRKTFLTEREDTSIRPSYAKYGRAEQPRLRTNGAADVPGPRRMGYFPAETELQVEGVLLDNPGSAAEWTASVREVSRAVQRDARRYDGGFSIY